MAGFWMHSTAALAVGAGAGLISYCVIPDTSWVLLAAIVGNAFLGGHLPGIQQPSSASYRVIRNSSALAALVFPVIFYLYRPTDILLAWLANYLLYYGIWWIIDRTSLYRDYTRSTLAIIFLPLGLTMITYSLLGQKSVLPVFLATSTSYVLHLLLEQQGFGSNRYPHSTA